MIKNIYLGHGKHTGTLEELTEIITSKYEEEFPQTETTTETEVPTISEQEVTAAVRRTPGKLMGKVGDWFANLVRTVRTDKANNRNIGEEVEK